MFAQLIEEIRLEASEKRLQKKTRQIAGRSVRLRVLPYSDPWGGLSGRGRTDAAAAKARGERVARAVMGMRSPEGRKYEPHEKEAASRSLRLLRRKEKKHGIPSRSQSPKTIRKRERKAQRKPMPIPGPGPGER